MRGKPSACFRALGPGTACFCMRCRRPRCHLAYDWSVAVQAHTAHIAVPHVSTMQCAPDTMSGTACTERHRQQRCPCGARGWRLAAPEGPTQPRPPQPRCWRRAASTGRPAGLPPARSAPQGCSPTRWPLLEDACTVPSSPTRVALPAEQEHAAVHARQ